MKADCSCEMSAVRANCSKAPQAKAVFVVNLLLALFCILYSCVIMSGINGHELSCMPNVCFTLSDVLISCVYC
jgi:hypothetical protein